MLEAFITANREAILARTRSRMQGRVAPKASDVELENGIPMFLGHLCAALRLARSSGAVDHQQLGLSAALHGHELLHMGLTIAQVVHDYGDVCQVVTALAVEQEAPIPSDEFRTLNLCLDDAIAEAVTAYSQQRERAIQDLGSERLGMLAHELRNLLNSAMLSFDAIRSGQVTATGSTGVVHQRSLIRLRDLIDRSLADVRLDSGVQRHETITVAEFIEEVEIGSELQAKARGVSFAVVIDEPNVTIEGDRQVLVAALSNLLQNAFKFTRKGSHVSLAARVTADRVSFEVEDECGGLPPGKVDDLFRPFEQRNQDRSGLGLGLSISRKAAKAYGGEIRIQDLPGKGCVFALDLPRQRPPAKPYSPTDAIRRGS